MHRARLCLCHCPASLVASGRALLLDDCSDFVSALHILTSVCWTLRRYFAGDRNDGRRCVSCVRARCSFACRHTQATGPPTRAAVNKLIRFSLLANRFCWRITPSRIIGSARAYENTMSAGQTLVLSHFACSPLLLTLILRCRSDEKRRARLNKQQQRGAECVLGADPRGPKGTYRRCKRGCFSFIVALLTLRVSLCVSLRLFCALCAGRLRDCSQARLLLPPPPPPKHAPRRDVAHICALLLDKRACALSLSHWPGDEDARAHYRAPQSRALTTGELISVHDAYRRSVSQAAGLARASQCLLTIAAARLCSQQLASSAIVQCKRKRKHSSLAGICVQRNARSPSCCTVIDAKRDARIRLLLHIVVEPFRPTKSLWIGY